jgi:hypothetical protein
VKAYHDKIAAVLKSINFRPEHHSPMVAGGRRRRAEGFDGSAPAFARVRSEHSPQAESFGHSPRRVVLKPTQKKEAHP